MTSPRELPGVTTVEATQRLQKSLMQLGRTVGSLPLPPPPAERLPIGSKVEIVPHQRDSSWPGGVGEIIEICPDSGGYMVRHSTRGGPIALGWCWDEVRPARPWWKRLWQPKPPREA